MNFELLYTDAAHTPEIVGANDVNNKAGRYDFTTVCYEIYFSEYGGTRSLYFFQGGVTREITIEKGKIYLIPPKIRHVDEVTKTSEDRSGFILFLKFQCEDFLGDFRIVRGNKRFEILADKFRREWLGRNPGFRIRCHAILAEIFEEFRKSADILYSKKKYEILRPAVDYIHENYRDEKISVEKLSGICKITPQYFHRLFLRAYGVTPHNYIENLRLQYARELLVTGKYAVAEAAFSAGYENASNFTRSFRRRFGALPADFFSDKRMK